LHSYFALALSSPLVCVGNKWFLVCMTDRLPAFGGQLRIWIYIFCAARIFSVDYWLTDCGTEIQQWCQWHFSTFSVIRDVTSKGIWTTRKPHEGRQSILPFCPFILNFLVYWTTSQIFTKLTVLNGTWLGAARVPRSISSVEECRPAIWRWICEQSWLYSFGSSVGRTRDYFKYLLQTRKSTSFSGFI
jgi:hypothetical protein